MVENMEINKKAVKVVYPKDGDVAIPGDGSPVFLRDVLCLRFVSQQKSRGVRVLQFVFERKAWSDQYRCSAI